MNNKSNSPKPFCYNRSKIKAFVLGADPTNFSDKGKTAELYYAFGIGQNPNYFRTILQNLNELGLHLEDIYIQNLLPESQKKETSKNIDYKKVAAQNTPAIAREFNKIDPSKKLPIFLTAEDIYRAVLNEDEQVFKALQLYKMETRIPIPSNANRFDRPIIPLFRHEAYDIKKWNKYKQTVIAFLENL